MGRQGKVDSVKAQENSIGIRVAAIGKDHIKYSRLSLEQQER